MSTNDFRSLLASVIQTPEPSPTMAETVANRLRDLIIDGQLPARTRLHLAPLASRLGVSVMPIREALRILETEGLVVMNPRRAAVVSEPSIEEAEEIYVMRVAVEALCARYATQRLTDANIADLRYAFSRMASAAHSLDIRGFVDRDHEFHHRLYQASGRDRLVESIAELVSRSLRYIPYLYRANESTDSRMEEHRALLRAAERRDARLAERLTREHMERAMVRLLTAIRAELESAEGREGRSSPGQRGGGGG